MNEQDANHIMSGSNPVGMAQESERNAAEKSRLIAAQSQGKDGSRGFIRASGGMTSDENVREFDESFDEKQFYLRFKNSLFQDHKQAD